MIFVPILHIIIKNINKYQKIPNLFLFCFLSGYNYNGSFSKSSLDFFIYVSESNRSSKDFFAFISLLLIYFEYCSELTGDRRGG